MCIPGESMMYSFTIKIMSYNEQKNTNTKNPLKSFLISLKSLLMHLIKESTISALFIRSVFQLYEKSN